MRPDAATLRLAVFPRSSLLTNVLLILGGAGFVALAAQASISLPFTPVPITGQTFAVVLVGATLGMLLAIASLGVYIFVGALGAPIYADQTHGWDVLTGPTGGYIIGFVFAAALTGFLAQERWDRRFSSAVAAMLSGNVVIYLFGTGHGGGVGAVARGHPRGGSLPVRRRRPAEAVPRRRASARRLDDRAPLQGLAAAQPGSPSLQRKRLIGGVIRGIRH